MKTGYSSNFIEKKKSIDFISNCNLQTTSDVVLHEHLSLILKGSGSTTTLFGAGHLLYRGIKYDQKPTYFDNLIYPPKEYSKISRANNDGEQIFYCSNLKKAPFYELNLNRNDKIVLTTWRLSKSLPTNNAGYTKSTLDRLDSSRTGYPHSLLNTDNISEENDFENELILDFISDAFCKIVSPDNKTHFKLTIAISKILFAPQIFLDKTVNNTEAIYYPTIQNNGDGDNFAIKPQFIDNEGLLLQQVEFIEIISVKDNRYQYKILDIANEVVGNEIKWKNLQNTWTVFDDSDELYFTDEFGELEAYNSVGEKVNADIII